jgi:hypothetical protein
MSGFDFPIVRDLAAHLPSHQRADSLLRLSTAAAV